MPRTRIERIMGTDDYRVTIDRVQFTLSLADFQVFSQQVLDRLQVLVGEKEQRKSGT